MYYLKNISDEILVDPETGKQIKPAEVKSFNNAMEFERFLAIHNGKAAVVTEREYNLYIGSFGELARKSEEQKTEEQEEKPKRGRSSKK